MKHIFNKDKGEDHNFWMSYTDLMSGFLIVFILASIVSYVSLEEERENYNKLCKIIKVENPDSLKNYIKDLEKYKDSIESSSLKNRINEYSEIFTSTTQIKVEFDTIRGSIKLTHQDENSDLFDPGKAVVKSPLKEYLDKRYMSIVDKTIEINKNTNSDVELRIEGHTDPTWKGEERGSNVSFMKNLTLSSERANAVYNYILCGRSLSYEQVNFVKRNMISVGYSFSDRVSNNNIDDKTKDPDSRRIEFRIISK